MRRAWYAIGPSALRRIERYASVLGWIPEGGELLGEWDDVKFTVIEARLVLDFVNTTHFAELDQELALDRRAAAGIVEAQPLLSVEDLAAVRYVGRKALTTLKTAALANHARKIVTE